MGVLLQGFTNYRRIMRYPCPRTEDDNEAGSLVGMIAS